MRLNDKRHKILRMLVAILEESQNPTAIAVASHDLGMFDTTPEERSESSSPLQHVSVIYYFANYLLHLIAPRNSDLQTAPAMIGRERGWYHLTFVITSLTSNG